MFGMLTTRRTQSARWPFWLLLAAWVCANSPQSATYAVLSWMAESRSFSHQHRLTGDVASLLGGERVRGSAAIAHAANPAPSKPLPPVPPPEAVLKKFPLSLELLAEMLPPGLRAGCPFAPACVGPDSFRARPPHEPPRVAVV